MVTWYCYNCNHRFDGPSFVGAAICPDCKAKIEFWKSEKFIKEGAPESKGVKWVKKPSERDIRLLSTPGVPEVDPQVRYPKKEERTNSQQKHINYRGSFYTPEQYKIKKMKENFWKGTKILFLIILLTWAILKIRV